MRILSSLVFILLEVVLLCNGDCPFGKMESAVSQNDRNYIVNEHNRLRIKLATGNLEGQPRAVNLKRIHWDNRLADAAQRIANTCVYGHVRVTDSRWQVGQNIATSWSTALTRGANWAEPVTNWWNEYRKYKYPNQFAMATGHYTQMAWDDTMYIGCGYSFFQRRESPQYQKIYVCNYGPAGNFPRAPYKTGQSGCENLC